tara:strand:+ start:33150 stop:33371 length:222 start_codon:yes stop_codon:yes gene_type:complete
MIDPMGKNEEKLIKNLNDRANDHTPILTPHPHFEDRFQVSYFYVRDHADLLLTARALVYLCMRTLDPDDGADR